MLPIKITLTLPPNIDMIDALVILGCTSYVCFLILKTIWEDVKND